ncbi:dihydrolipoyl dehydrogenase [Bacillus sp. FJAT-47783]|uniref:dihydrolipoyl dehydrogenase n=1 Tax=Bacillus sp. FJAT-47783 TaxID=2922712 RepID=UPI001FAD81E1|nr:dihydrolipoyl dehydrogenase [Bacillus sp. FJAT-47783]
MVVGSFSVHTEVLVIGGGPGGYSAAIRAAQLGKEVTLVEKSTLGGVCLNEGCIPSKALIAAAEDFYNLQDYRERGIEVEQPSINFQKFQEWKDKQVISKLSQGVSALCKNNHVTIVEGEATFTGNHEVRIVSEYSTQTIHFEQCILATGSRPIEFPALPFGGRILSSTEALSLKEVPKSMIVVGGGYIGIELGTAYAKLGTSVTILEAAPTILAQYEKSIVSIVKKKLKKLHVDVQTGAYVTSSEVSENDVKVKIEMKGEEKQLHADYCLVTTGRRPNTDGLGLETIGLQTLENGFIAVDHQCRTDINHIFAIGDIVPGPALAHKASYEGKIAAEAIARMDSIVDYQAIPAVVFSDPEIAVVGLSEEEAKEQGNHVKVGKFPFIANGRALSTNESEGFVKVIADENDYVLGVQIIGSHASDLIGEAALAIEMGAKVDDICLTIHPHPTLTEGLLEASEVLLKKAIHIVNS